MTERPFHNAYDRFEEGGYYVIWGTTLFLPSDVCTWLWLAKFLLPLPKMVHYYQDHSHGMERLKFVSHSGQYSHVFTDGPKDQGGLLLPLALLRFIPKRGNGYGNLLPALIR